MPRNILLRVVLVISIITWSIFSLFTGKIDASTVTNFSCLTPFSGTMLTSNIGANAPSELHLFLTNPPQGGNSCATGYYPDIPIHTIGSNYNATYENSFKDSLMYYPGHDNVAITSGYQNNNIYAIKWNFLPTAIPQIDPTSVEAITLATNITSSVDLTVDDQGSGGTPKYLWNTGQLGLVIKIPWSQVTSRLDPWISNGTVPAPINVNSQQTQGNAYIFLSGYDDNGIVTDGGNVYINGETAYPTQQSVTVMKFNKTLVTTLFPGGAGLPDGMTVSADKKYIFVTSGTNGLNRATIEVIQNANTNNPSVLGDALVNNMSYLDGIQVDNYGQLYLAAGQNGIFSVNGNDLIASAIANGVNVNGTNTLNAQQYVGATPGQKWDDMAPMAGSNIAYNPYTSYYLTRNGGSYSTGGYSASSLSNDSSTNNAAYFSTYLAQSGNANASFGNGAGSQYNWNLNNFSANGQYTYAELYSNLCQGGGYTCTSLNLASGIDTNTASLQGGIYTYNTNGGTLSIDTDGGMPNASGILFVNGLVNIIANHSASPVTNNHLLVIATGDVNVAPASWYTQSATVAYQHLDMGIITDGNLNFNNYPNMPVYVQPMIATGMFVSYGHVSLSLNLGILNQYYPAITFEYDPSYIVQFSQYFLTANFSQVHNL